MATDSHGTRPLDCARASGHVHLVAGGTTWMRTNTNAFGITADARRTAAPGAAPAPMPAATGAGDRCPPSMATVAAAAGGGSGNFNPSDGSSYGASTASNAYSDMSSSVANGSLETSRMPTGTPTTNAAGTLVGNSPLGSPMPFVRSISTEPAADFSGAAAAASAAAVAAPAGKTADAARQGSGMIGLLRELPAALRAPFVNDGVSECCYVCAVGAAYVTWSCCYLVYQVGACGSSCAV